jgi:flagellar biosynthesis/type III secretory pathway chaperone
MTTSGEELSHLLAKLGQVLEEERRILLSGSPEDITGIVERKLLLAELIEKECEIPGIMPPDVKILTWLERYNRGNSAICSAMLRHLTRMLDTLRQYELHRSYGPDGAESSPPSQNPLGAA